MKRKVSILGDCLEKFEKMVCLGSMTPLKLKLRLKKKGETRKETERGKGTGRQNCLL